MKTVLKVILIQAVAYFIVCLFGWMFVLGLSFEVWRLIPAALVSSIVHMNASAFTAKVFRDQANKDKKGKP